MQAPAYTVANLGKDHGMGHEAKDHIELKQQAKRLRTALEAMGHVVSHSAALELIAQSLGYRDWNTAAARHPAQEGHAPVPPAPNRPLWEMGGRVQGAYLGNRFEGTVVGVSRKGNTHHEISIDCDTPVNVSRSALFDAPRKRIRATIDEDGRSVGMTSDGVPHLVLGGMQWPVA